MDFSFTVQRREFAAGDDYDAHLQQCRDLARVVEADHHARAGATVLRDRHTIASDARWHGYFGPDTHRAMKISRVLRII